MLYRNDNVNDIQTTQSCSVNKLLILFVYEMMRNWARNL